ncbi:peptide-methionine (S)-S-oxide reductase [Taibaiella sp. KBW10]|uniref:peptide-methionine (S)-S-oxide reductase MsrA n=1 Tax=Taibaiella sp. KBW10 TaxID=2153357 RepID=UPI000F59266D|nr:peptide-methionine (S)-S-oxide reductase MsrA [Taibaiella sp. KBW10]RQO30162.1 peptide-methionine (S)-S-oxide reductase [Taibaiella sp. KBW10]
MIRNYFLFITLVLLTFASVSCGQGTSTYTQSNTFKKMNEFQENPDAIAHKKDSAIFAAGCFWCVEGQFQNLKGVISVKSGYIGGTVAQPTYEQVCTGTTGHAEAVKVVYDPSVVSYDELLAAFFVSHDPTQLNRQGNDIGTQYRSAIFPQNESQKEKANYYIAQLNEEKAYTHPIVTTIEGQGPFYDAEAYHDDYFNRNPENSYCQLVVKPKIEKFKKVFANKLKP